MTAAAALPPPLSVRGAWSALRFPTFRELLYSIKGMIAVSLSLLIGFSQNLENPYWSALTIYVLMAQPQTGAIRSKALFRLAGTAIGGGGAILIATLFASHIGVSLIVTIVAVLVTYYAKTLDRTPANYTWFAASLTLAVIGIVHVQQPQTIFGFGVTRMGEISLGILVIGIVDSIMLPRAATPDFVHGMIEWRDKAGAWAAAALAPDASMEPDERWRRRLGLRELAALFGPLDAQGVQLPYDTVAVPPRGHDLRFVTVTISHLIARLAAANLWIEASRSDDGGDAEAAAAAVREWVAERPGADDPAMLDHAARGDALHDRLIDRFDEIAAIEDHDRVLQATVRLRLAELVQHWARLDRTLHAIATGRRMPRALRAIARRARPVRSIDHLVGLLDIAPLALALTFGATIWYATAWTAGINATLFSFVCLGFTIGTPGAVRSAGGTLLWTALAFVFAFLYLFAVLPRVTTFPVLIAVLAAGTIPLGLLMAMTPAGLLILANGFAFLGLQNAYQADFATTLQSMAGSLAGCLMAVAALFLCQFDRPRLRARRLARALDRDIADIARARRTPDPDRLISLSVDRIAQFFAIVAALPPDDPLQAEDLVARLRVASNLLALRGEEHGLSARSREDSAALRAAIAQAHARGRAPDDHALLRRVQRAYETILAEPATAARSHALAALTGLRLALAPDPAFEARMLGAVA